MQFEVLYSKRSNKVHKSRGVSKFDGILTVEAGIVSLRDAVQEDSSLVEDLEDKEEEATGKATWKRQQQQRGVRPLLYTGRNMEISQRLLHVDDSLVLGAYEVQIISCLSSSTITCSNSQQQTGRPPTLTSQAPSTVSNQCGSSRLEPSFPESRTVVPQKRLRMKVPLQCKKLRLGKENHCRPAVAGVASKGTTSSGGGPSAIVKNAECGGATPPTCTFATGLSVKAPPPPPRALPVPPPQPRRPLQPKELVRTGVAVLSSRQGVGLPRQQAAGHRNTSPVPAPPPTTTTTTAHRSFFYQRSSSATSPPTGILPHIPLPATLAQSLRPHQVSGIDFLWKALVTTRRDPSSPAISSSMATSSGHDGGGGGAILADEPGLGKTLMTIAIICAMHRRQRHKPFIVVCPSSLVTNWAHEFDKWIGRAGQPKRVVIHKGGADGVSQMRSYQTSNQCNNGQVLILSYDLLRINANVLNHSQSFALVVVDEGHRLKNSAGSLTLTALEGLPTDARLCLTATPIQNNLSEFYNLANFVRPGSLGDLASFRREFERPITALNQRNVSSQIRARGRAQSQALEAITKKFLLRRLQKDILKTLLPPRTEVLLFCRLTERQCHVYRQITNEVLGVAAGATADALTALTALRKVCCHPYLNKSLDELRSDDDTKVAVSMSGKLVVLDELLRSIREHAPGDKVVVVSNYTSALYLLETLIMTPNEYTYSRLDGTTDVQNRQALVDTFNRVSNQFCFLLSSKAGGCGLNLIGANRLVLLDPDWNPANDVQAMGRVYRQGQTKPTIIYRLFAAGTVEEVVYQRQLQKGNLATLTVDGGNNSSCNRFTKEELVDCFTLKGGCECDTYRRLGHQWLEYDGAESLRSRGCVDLPLLDVAETASATLGFVHIVDESDTASLENYSNTGSRGPKPLCDSSTGKEDCDFSNDNDERERRQLRPSNLADSEEDDEFEF